MRIPEFQTSQESICFGMGANDDVACIADMKLKLNMLDMIIKTSQEVKVCDNHTMKTAFNRQMLREAIETAEGELNATYLRYVPKEVLFFDFMEAI